MLLVFGGEVSFYFILYLQKTRIIWGMVDYRNDCLLLEELGGLYGEVMDVHKGI